MTDLERFERTRLPAHEGAPVADDAISDDAIAMTVDIVSALDPTVRAGHRDATAGDERSIAADLPFLPSPSGWTDPFTTLDGPIYWARLLSSERARIRRYRRPATVVLFGIVGLDRLAHQWGDDVAVHCTLQVARTLSRHIRSSDHAARIGRARFGAFLPETNEIDAINFVERCRAAIVRDIGAAADSITLGIGWAGPVDSDLGAAVDLAESRLERELDPPA